MKQNSRLADSNMAADITRAIECITTIPTESLSIRVRNGRVCLRGTLKERHQREFVEEVVSHLDGVNGVTDLITVGPQVISRN
jgi:osmotically-inducible protein OsmY